MTQILRPELVRLVSDLFTAWEEISGRSEHEVAFELFGPVSVELRIEDGLMARFFEEGIEFYPKEES